jgi:hypothetical protein
MKYHSEGWLFVIAGLTAMMLTHLALQGYQDSKVF